MSRMMSPDGSLGDVPPDNLDAALAAGFRLMTDDNLRDMYNRLHVEHSLFQEKERQTRAKFENKRMSLRMRMRRKRA